MGKEKKKLRVLTEKQELFAQLFVKYGTPIKALREAYPKSKNWKRTTASNQAGKILNKPHVKARVEELRDRMAAKLDISPERTLREFARIGFSDVRRLFDEDGNLLQVTALDRNTAAAVSSVKVRQVPGTDDQIAEVKFWPKTAALESLSKHLGLFEKDNRQKSTALAEILKEIDKGGLPAPPG